MAGAGGDDLKLLGMWASPPVLRVRLALSIKGISYEYLEEDFDNKSELLLRSNPVHNKLLKAMYQASFSKTEGEKVEGGKQVTAALKNLEGALSDVAEGKPFFGGDAPGYVDTVLGGILAWVRAMLGVKTFDPVTMPLLAAWADHFGALDAVEAVMPDVNRLVEFSMAM